MYQNIQIYFRFTKIHMFIIYILHIEYINVLIAEKYLYKLEECILDGTFMNRLETKE